MFKGFSKRQSFHGFPQNGGFGMAQNVAYDKTGCQWHFDAGNGHTYLNGQSVAFWSSLIDGFTIFQNTAGFRPVFRLNHPDFNNNPAIEFGVNTELNPFNTSKTVVPQVSPISVGVFFIVSQSKGFSNANVLISGNSAATGRIDLGQTVNGICVNGQINSGVKNLLPHITAIRAGQSGFGAIWVDGVKTNGVFNNFSLYNTFGSAGTSNGPNAFIGEILFYNSFFSDQDILDVSNALNSKYAIY